MKKIFALSLAVLMLLGFTCSCAPEQTGEVSKTETSTPSIKETDANPASDFEYTLSDYDTIYITRYIGEDDTVVIPSEIDGKIVNFVSNSSFKNTAIKSVVISDTVEVIGMDAFLNCDNLENIEFGSGITTIRNQAFLDCDKLEKVILPKNLETIESESFMNCYSLKEVYIPKSITGFSMNAFCGCTSLTKLTIEDGIENLKGTTIFAGCAIEELNIPASVTEMGDMFFGYLPTLKSIKTHGNAPSTKYLPAYKENNKEITLYYKEGTTGWDNYPYNEYTLKTY